MTAARPYAPARSGAILRPMKTRHQFYLPDDLTEQLHTLARKPGASKTQILTDALRAWIDRKAARELDARFGPRLDRLAQYTEANRHGIDAITEMLALFIQHQLTLVAHHPPFDDNAQRLGGERIDAFLELVERRLTGKGKRQRLLGEDLP
ncbi:ribbon-helix-helix CopG family protein [Sphingosinicella microcystinivorans]|uniref:Ribbon-helix-helix CopG family protein n=2 Tax=Sphingosinicella microcystinivorans TaxID=335406 RepID=A0ABX9SUX9_SPHMI|nr:ribbon-helix-helix CopG family protein [Sphingosinicella microcystinivorans]